MLQAKIFHLLFIFKERILKMASQLKFPAVFIPVSNETLTNERGSYGKNSHLGL
jgi:hypothetical protein